MARDADGMRLLELARARGLISDEQLIEIHREHTAAEKAGLRKSPTQLAMEKGYLSDEASRDLATDQWIIQLPTHLNGYRLVRLLGRGGMAVVFEAQDVSLGKVVALKILLPEFASSDNYLARFTREAHIAAKLTHPNTVQVFRAGEQEGIHYLVMEYIEGETLSQVIQQRGRMPEKEALDIALQLCGALEEASELGIVHRDVKPGNVLMSKWGLPKLADFGIAKEFSDIAAPQIQRSLTMGVVGTPSYMSPEQARGSRAVDFRSDICSLGATLYHMVIGDMPYHADSPQETMVRVLSDTPRAPLAARPDLSEAAGAVLCRMMAKEPEDRHQSYAELQNDLTAARNGGQVSIRYRDAVKLLRPSRPQDAARAASDNPMRAALIAGAVAILGLLILRSCAGS